MSYSNIETYYWSGTGNSLRVAKWVSEIANEHGISSTITPIWYKKDDMSESSSNTLLGIVMPTHGFTAPWPMIKFCFRLKRKRDTDAIVVATRGGIKPGIYIRGLSCSATFVIAMILLLKGFNIMGLLSVDMPINWIPLLPGLKEKDSEHFINKAKTRIGFFINNVLDNKKQIVNLDNTIEFISGLATIIISIFYIIIGRYFLAKLLFANNKCTSCKICAENCPHSAIKMKGKSDKLRPYWTFSCESCMKCVNYCPVKAIEGGQSIALIFMYISSLPVAYKLLEWITIQFSWISNINNSVTEWLVGYPYKLSAFFLTYLIIYYLIKIPFINNIFTYTTLTHIYRRYHEPSTKLKDLK